MRTPLPRVPQHALNALLVPSATVMLPNALLVVRVSTARMALPSAQLAAPASTQISVNPASCAQAGLSVWEAAALVQRVIMARLVVLGRPRASHATPEGCSPHTTSAPLATVRTVPVLPTLTAV